LLLSRTENKCIHLFKTKIIFEHINEKYAYGAYGDFKVIIMKKNNYINATKLCNENNKRYEYWSRNLSNEELINKVKKRK